MLTETKTKEIQELQKMVNKVYEDKRELEFKLKEQVIAYNDLIEGAKK